MRKLLLGSVVAGFAIGTATLAASQTIQTWSFQSIDNESSGIYVGIAGGTWAQNGISGLYVDGQAFSAGSMEADLIRYSYTGTRTESVGVLSFGTGDFDLGMSTSQMAVGPSVWDYYLLGVYGSPNEFTSQVFVWGVSTYAN
jgi:hypothetical protein